VYLERKKLSSYVRNHKTSMKQTVNFLFFIFPC